MVAVSRFDICLVNLDPTYGSEIKKTRPCLIISPNEINKSKLNSVIIAPMTGTVWAQHPTRIDIQFQEKRGQIALEQIRTIDRRRILKVVGKAPKSTAAKVLGTLQIMFAE